MSNRVRLCFLVALSLAGCARRKDPYYCPGANPNDNCAEDAGPMACTSNDGCAAPLGVCDVIGSGTCVQCTPDQAGACSGATPACGEDRTCRACRAHAECPGSAACLPDGTCADPAQVAYVQPTSLGGTDNTSCMLTFPCTKVARALATGRPYVKLAGTTDEAVIVQGAQVVTFLAEPDAKLTRTGSAGAILTVRESGTSLTVYDLSISNAPNDPNGIGIVLPAGGAPTLTLIRAKVMNNPGGGIFASGGALAVSQSTISGNAGGGISVTGGALMVAQSTISGNAGGGISVTGVGATFEITNCLIFRNGNSSTSIVGGGSLSASGGANVFAFNTVVDNQIQNSGVFAGGVFCDIPGFAGANNIIVRNFVANDPTRPNSNTSGLCTYPTSAISTTVSGLRFVSPDDAPHNYRIMRGSTAIDQATTPSNLAVDIDGDARPQGSNRDQGADEVP